MPPSALVRKVADYCWSSNFLDVFHKYFADNAEAFIGAPEMHNGEHNLEYYQLFTEYLQVYEDTLVEYLNTMDESIEEFYRQVRECSEDEGMDDPYLKVFIDCLLASMNYDSFYKVMVREGKKRATLLKKQELAERAEDKRVATNVEPYSGSPDKMSGGGGAEGKGISIDSIEMTADAKSSGAEESDSKGSYSPAKDDK